MMLVGSAVNEEKLDFSNFANTKLDSSLPYISTCLQM